MLRQKLQTDQIQALKSHDQGKLEVLRYILAQIKNKEIDKKAELADDEVVSMIRKQIKDLNEANVAFARGGRTDLVEANNKQKDILSAYLPQEISDEELKQEVQKIIEENREMYEKNPKTIIGICVSRLKSKADPSRIIKLVS